MYKHADVAATGCDAVRGASALCAEGEEAVSARGDSRVPVADHRFGALEARAIGHVAHCGEARVEQQPLVAIEQLLRHVYAHETRVQQRLAPRRRTLELRHAALCDALREELAETRGAEHVPAAVHSDAVAPARLAHTDRTLVRAGAERGALFARVVVDEQLRETLASSARRLAREGRFRRGGEVRSGSGGRGRRLKRQ